MWDSPGMTVRELNGFLPRFPHGSQLLIPVMRARHLAVASLHRLNLQATPYCHTVYTVRIFL